MSFTKRAFTLIELSIVLVVIGLIVSGIIAGSSIVAAGKVRGQISQLTRYQTATHTFKAQYEQWPGDFDRATSYWSTSVSGNGNGYINDSLGSGAAYDDVGGSAAALNGEKLQYFVHLASGGFIPGTFTGTATSGPGLGYEKTVIDPNGGMAAVAYWTDCAGHSGSIGPSSFNNICGDTGGKYLYLAMVYCATGDGSAPWGMTNCNIFKPAESKAIDTKLDDGLYNKGKFYSLYSGFGSGGPCISGGAYNTSSSKKECLSMYRLQ